MRTPQTVIKSPTTIADVDEVERVIKQALRNYPQADEAFGVREVDGWIKVVLYQSGDYYQTISYCNADYKETANGT